MRTIVIDIHKGAAHTERLEFAGPPVNIADAPADMTGTVFKPGHMSAVARFQFPRLFYGITMRLVAKPACLGLTAFTSLMGGLHAAESCGSSAFAPARALHGQ